MTQSEKNRKFGKLLARMFYGSNVRTLPFILNSEQAEAFKQEWCKLEYNIDTSAEHPVKDDDIVRTILKNIELQNKKSVR